MAVVAPIIDMFITEGWRALFRVGIALLRRLEPVLMGMEMFEMSAYFRDTLRTQPFANQFDLFRQASLVHVNTITVSLLYNLCFCRFTTENLKSCATSFT
jgi:hypothetical protein